MHSDMVRGIVKCVYIYIGIYVVGGAYGQKTKW